jgi:hypothetical protein
MIADAITARESGDAVNTAALNAEIVAREQAITGLSTTYNSNYDNTISALDALSADIDSRYLSLQNGRIADVTDIQNQIDAGSGAAGKTRLISRIGSLLLVRVNGLGNESGALEDLKLLGPKKIFYEKKPQGFEILFRNDGNVHLVPSGKIKVKNMLGKIVAELPVDAYFALPDSLRYREVQWDGGFGFGRYTANLSLYRGYGNQFDEDSLAFWVLPWKVLVGIFLVLCVFYYISRKFEFRKK